MSQRESFSSNLGFVLACTGAAVGLGNLWMFPWRLGQYGGAAFLVPYLFFVYVLGTTGLMGEYGLGRWAAKGPMGAYDKVLRAKGLRFGRVLGAYPALSIWAIMVFYAIVTGWVIRYVVSSMTGAYLEAESTGVYFGGFAGQAGSIPWQALALVLALCVIIFGIAKGLERVNKIIMPVMFGLFLLLLVRSVTLPGAGAGLRHIFVPDWSYLLEPITWGMALGQAFFTVSLNGAGMVVFGSYLRRDADLPASAVQTVSLDTVAALMAALIVMPAVFAYDLDPAAGPPLLFITLPEIFRAMPGGQVIGFVFFVSVLLAALSSLLSMTEVCTEALMDQFKWSRKTSVVVAAGSALMCGLPLALNMNWFTLFVDLMTIYIVPAGAVVAATLFFWIYGVEKARQEINVGAKRPLGPWWNPVAKYVFVGIASLIVILQMLFQVG